MNIISKVSKATDLLKTKYLMMMKQKIFIGEKYNIKYILEVNNKSDDLLILFTACTKEGQKARYNYIRTVEEFNCNKLFILDDFGYDERGAYYLGKNGDFHILRDVELLINTMSKKVDAKKEVFIGSSKGGYAALFFGITRENSYIIAGAPQYNLGDYLAIPNHRNILKYIMGNENDTSIETLNSLMKNRLDKYDNENKKIYLHYSSEEETYTSDIKPLINKLNMMNINKNYDEHKYRSHGELTKYFPKYIKYILKDEIKIR